VSKDYSRFKQPPGLAQLARAPLARREPEPEPPSPKRRTSKQQRVIAFILGQLEPNADRDFVVGQILARWNAACRQLGIKRCKSPDPRTIDKHIPS
jgi:hypothetical protein